MPPLRVPKRPAEEARVVPAARSPGAAPEARVTRAVAAGLVAVAAASRVVPVVVAAVRACR
jgi:hypothetical protein